MLPLGVYYVIKAEETNDELFLHCPMVIYIWEQVLSKFSISIRLHKQNTLEAWNHWRDGSFNQKIHCLPLIICCTIWLNRNGFIFIHTMANWPSSITKIINAYHDIPEDDHTPPGHVVALEVIDRNLSWAYFDGAAQDQ